MKSFADQFKAKHDKLDVLVNNAGEYVPPDDITEDGFEVSRWGAQPGCGHRAEARHNLVVPNDTFAGCA